MTTALVKLPGYSKPDKSDMLPGFPTISRPTVVSILQRHEAAKAWWLPRDIMVRQFQRMAELESPFQGTDKAGLEAGGRVEADGSVIFAAETFPFAVLTRMISGVAKLHPDLRPIPTSPKHTAARMEEYEQFIQGAMDMRLKSSNLVTEAMWMLAVTGWLILYYPYDSQLKKRKEFPFNSQVLSPLGVYPNFDSRKQARWVTMERRMSGADLLDAYIGQDGETLPGLAELYSSEPDPEDAGGEWNKTGNNFLTSDFTVITYYDSVYKCILVDGSDVSDTACRFNPALDRLRKQSKSKKYASVQWHSDHEDDPYAGVLSHKLGRLPFTFRFCWPESHQAGESMQNRGYTNTGQPNSGQWGGHYGGLPLLFGVYPLWRDMCRTLSQFFEINNRAADPIIVTDSQEETFQGDVARMGPDEKANYMTAPGIQPDQFKLWQELRDQASRSTISDAAEGAPAGATSGLQQSAMAGAGAVRLDTPLTETEWAFGHAYENITQIMVDRGSEDVAVYARGERFNSGPYYLTYNPADKLGGVAPSIECTFRGYATFEPNKVAMYTSLVGQHLISTETGMTKILELPNAKAEIERLKQEALAQTKDVIEPLIEIAGLKAQVETIDEKEDLTWQLDDKTQDWTTKNEKRTIEKKFARMPADMANQQAEQMQQQLMTAIGLSQPPSTSNGTPAMSPDGAPPPPPSGPPMGPNGTPSGPPPGMGLTLSLPGNSLTPMGPPPGLPMMRPNLPPPGMGNAPGQANRIFQPLTVNQPPGGIGRPGVPPQLIGPNQGTEAQGASPAIAAANAAMQPPTLPPVTTSEATRRNKTRRGKRGK